MGGKVAIWIGAIVGATVLSVFVLILLEEVLVDRLEWFHPGTFAP